MNEGTYPKAIHINHAHMKDTQNRLIARALATCGVGGGDQPVVA
jgi:hypothetical protein